MNTVLNISLARNDGKPDNGVLSTVATINQYGFIFTSVDVTEIPHQLGIERVIVASVRYVGKQLSFAC
ncbi:hypothetical protein ACQUFY_05780 [Robbsia andropogonis]|uniref:hypothetical protein n=1 Tax=Robbsia andropogonis TaxID=28092 RepID=UPI003D1A3F05